MTNNFINDLERVCNNNNINIKNSSIKYPFDEKALTIKLLKIRNLGKGCVEEIKSAITEKWYTNLTQSEKDTYWKNFIEVNKCQA